MGRLAIKMYTKSKILYFSLVVFVSNVLYSDATELTFELEDNARQCFHEVMVNETKCTLEFQVCYSLET